MVKVQTFFKIFSGPLRPIYQTSFSKSVNLHMKSMIISSKYILFYNDSIISKTKIFIYKVTPWEKCRQISRKKKSSFMTIFSCLELKIQTEQQFSRPYFFQTFQRPESLIIKKSDLFFRLVDLYEPCTYKIRPKPIIKSV